MPCHLRFIANTLVAPEYDCSAHEPEEWARVYGERKVVHGVWSIALGTICMFLYLPALRVFGRERRATCFKARFHMMYFLAFVDTLGCLTACLFFGVLMLIGTHFCSHPLLVLFTGVGAHYCWTVSSFNCLFLVLNRISELTDRERYFQGWKSTLLMASSAVYALLTILFTRPHTISTVYQIVTVNPHIPGFEPVLYASYALTIHNAIIAVSIPSLYFILCCLVNTRANRMESTYATRLQAQIFTQASVVCFVNVGAAIIFAVMAFVQLPKIVIVMGMIFYQLVHASPSLIYLALNRSVRDELRKMIGVKHVALPNAFTSMQETRTTVVETNS